MSVPAPPSRFFDANTASITPPLDDGWAHLQEGSICRPWMVQVFNLRLSDFVAAPTSLADLAFADHAGNPIENAGDLGAIVGLLTTLPSEVRMTPAKGSPAVPATFKSGKHSHQRTQLVLEPLRSPLEPFHVVGLRIHCLLYDT